MIDSLDHLVLTVRDLGATVAFHTDVLGMEEVTVGPGRKALQFGQQKLNLHEYGRQFEPKARTPAPASADLCLITRIPVDEFAARLGGSSVPAEKVGDHID